VSWVGLIVSYRG